MLYYIHGYHSSPDSRKGILFTQELKAKAIQYRDVEPEDLVINDCLKRISEVIKNDDNVTLIGSSLGGYLAASAALDHENVRRIILLNPAIPPPSLDVTTVQGMSHRILKEMINPQLFQQRINADIMIIRGTEDIDIPDRWVLEFAMAQEAMIQFLHDDHRFSKLLEKLPKIIKQMLKEYQL
jgi:pimeloyl-ACP methyl ester carboxylesterase